MMMKQYKKDTLALISVLIIMSLFQNCKKNEIINDEIIDTAFKNETKVIINGYSGDAMEPFITKDEKYLFFNSLTGDNEKDLFYAEKVNDTVFNFKGEIQGVNTAYVDANPTMDSMNNFYFISTRNLDNGNKTLFCGTFNNGTVSGLKEVNGTINISTPFWINMGVEITEDGNTMFVSNAKFNIGDNFPNEGDIRFAVKNGSDFNIPDNESDILKNINNDYSIQYAGEISADGSELFYSQVTLSNPPVFKLFYSKKNQSTGVFEPPVTITEPFKDDKNAFVEAPSLSKDGKRLYYHKLSNDTFYIYMLTRG